MEWTKTAVATLLAGVIAAGALGAPGDEVARIRLPASCNPSAAGLAFDGELLYYSQRGDPVSGRIHKVRAATGAYEGELIANRGGEPVGLISGLAYDPNRTAVWANASLDLTLVSPETGEVMLEYGMTEGFGTGLAYDSVLDDLWLSDQWTGAICHWLMNAGCYPGGMNMPTLDGLTFEGVDLWAYTAERIPFEFPEPANRVFPIETQYGEPDYTRLIEVPAIGGWNYYDIAYDCRTFPVPVVWMAVVYPCLLVAYEVESRAPCPAEPDHLSRLSQEWRGRVDRAALIARLPLTSRSADQNRQVWRPLAHRDLDAALVDSAGVVVWRLLGPGDADRGNVLRLRKEGNDVVVAE